MVKENGNKRDQKIMGFSFTSESVTEGHPDQVCAKVAEACVDAALAVDSNARIAIEPATCRDFMLLMGEVTMNGEVDFEKVARDTVRGIGYTFPDKGYDADTLEILNKISKQSPDIALGVDKGGAGDQGLMFGCACSDTPEKMPLSVMLSRDITNKLTALFRKNPGEPLYPDGKAQVTVRYGRGVEPVGIDTIVVSCMHKDIPIEEVREYIKTKVVKPVLKKRGWSLDGVQLLINPTGRFVEGGPAADSGLNGRKIVVDTFGGYCPHGGGALSGKDPTKVDRSAVFMARYIAKNIVASGVAPRAEVQLAYAIGVDKPVSMNVKCYGTCDYPLTVLVKAIERNFDCSPRGIIEKFGLTQPTWKYADLVSTGYFGDEKLPWEKTDKSDAIKDFCEINSWKR